jgi:hypothetical protein
VEGTPAARPTRGLWIGIIVAALVVVLLVPMAFGAGLALHLECGLTPLGTESVWTPGVVVNSPPNGSARGWGNGSQLGADGGSPLLGNGSAGVLEVEMTWTVDRTGMVWTAGPGLRDACTQPYWATASAATGTANSAWCPLQGPGNASDVGLSTDTASASCPFLGTSQSAMFHDAFETSCPTGSAYDGGCGAYLEDVGSGIRFTMHVSALDFPVEIPVPGQPAGTWLGVGDPMNQTVLYWTTGPGCWIHESAGASTGLPSGLQTWGSSASVPGQGQTAPCTFG